MYSFWFDGGPVVGRAELHRLGERLVDGVQRRAADDLRATLARLFAVALVCLRQRRARQHRRDDFVRQKAAVADVQAIVGDEFVRQRLAFRLDLLPIGVVRYRTRRRRRLGR